MAAGVVQFDDGSPDLDLADLVGDGDAEYIVVIDSSLADGFQGVADADLTEGSGSLPQYGYKVGIIPEPATAGLLALGLAALATRRRI